MVGLWGLWTGHPGGIVLPTTVPICPSDRQPLATTPCVPPTHTHTHPGVYMCAHVLPGLQSSCVESRPVSLLLARRGLCSHHPPVLQSHPWLRAHVSCGVAPHPLQPSCRCLHGFSVLSPGPWVVVCSPSPQLQTQRSSCPLPGASHLLPPATLQWGLPGATLHYDLSGPRLETASLLPWSQQQGWASGPRAPASPDRCWALPGSHRAV